MDIAELARRIMAGQAVTREEMVYVENYIATTRARPNPKLIKELLRRKQRELDTTREQATYSKENKGGYRANWADKCKSSKNYLV